MDAILKKALPTPLVLEAQLTGKRYTAAELEAQPGRPQSLSGRRPDERGLGLCQNQNKSREILKTMKEVTFKNILRVMETEDPAYLEALKGSFAR